MSKLKFPQTNISDKLVFYIIHDFGNVVENRSVTGTVRSTKIRFCTVYFSMFFNQGRNASPFIKTVRVSQVYDFIRLGELF